MAATKAMTTAKAVPGVDEKELVGPRAKKKGFAVLLLLAVLLFILAAALALKSTRDTSEVAAKLGNGRPTTPVCV